MKIANSYVKVRPLAYLVRGRVYKSKPLLFAKERSIKYLCFLKSKLYFRKVIDLSVLQRQYKEFPYILYSASTNVNNLNNHGTVI